MIRLAAFIFFFAVPLSAETVIAARTIRAQEIINFEDLAIHSGTFTGGVSELEAFVGMEARVALYAGRPVRLGDVTLPSVVERNGIVQLVYNQGGLTITTEGRALDRAAPGDLIRVMNLSSRTTVTARIANDGTARVSY